MDYETTLRELDYKFHHQRDIIKLYDFLTGKSSILRKHYFLLMEEYFKNELRNPDVTDEERLRLEALLNHWVWDKFAMGDEWFGTLVTDHADCFTLHKVLRSW